MTRGRVSRPPCDTVFCAYDASGTPLTVTLNGTKYYYITNLQGDVVAILDINGAQVVGYTYDAWGNVLSITGTKASTLGQINPLRYRGYVYDQETQLYYLQSRYYNPETGRFLNADAFAATGQGILGNNMFAYCGNNPVMRADPTGNSFWVIIPLIVIPLIFGGCSSKRSSSSSSQNEYALAHYIEKLRGAKDLDIEKASAGSYDCWGNAIGKETTETLYGYNAGAEVDEVFGLVQQLRVRFLDEKYNDGDYFLNKES